MIVAGFLFATSTGRALARRARRAPARGTLSRWMIREQGRAMGVRSVSLQ